MNKDTFTELIYSLFLTFRHLSDVDLDIFDNILQLCPDWPTLVRNLRYTAAGLVVVFGLWMLLVTLITQGSAKRLRGVEDWTPLQHALWPYLQLKYSGLPPT